MKKNRRIKKAEQQLTLTIGGVSFPISQVWTSTGTYTNDPLYDAKVEWLAERNTTFETLETDEELRCEFILVFSE